MTNLQKAVVKTVIKNNTKTELAEKLVLSYSNVARLEDELHKLKEQLSKAERENLEDRVKDIEGQNDELSEDLKDARYTNRVIENRLNELELEKAELTKIIGDDTSLEYGATT